MKKIISIALLTLGFTASIPAHAVEFWHSNTVWANQGMCSANITFDAGEEPVRNVVVDVKVYDSKGVFLQDDQITLDEAGDSDATRYGIGYLVSDVYCDDGLKIVVTKASAVINGKKTDLVKTKKLTVRDFKPFTIQVGNKK